MTSVGILFALPMLTDVMKNRSQKRNIIAFCFVCVLTLICGYNRIHMTNHFLSDVCFGCLITCLIFSGVSTAFLGRSTKTPSEKQEGAAVLHQPRQTAPACLPDSRYSGSESGSGRGGVSSCSHSIRPIRERCLVAMEGTASEERSGTMPLEIRLS